MSGNSSESDGDTKIPLLVEKAFLQIVEKRGQDRKGIVLKEVCDSNSELFGNRGSKIRRDLQHYWRNCKRRSIRNYVALLDRLKIAKGEETGRLLDAQGREPSLASEESEW
jgi:hypothetical protein